MKIKKIIISNFKKIEEQIEINFSEDISLFVGPNNSGKTTVLQALSLWGFLFDKWKKEGIARKNRGLVVNRLENIPLSVRDTSYLWNNSVTKKGNNKIIPIEITLVFNKENGEEIEYGFILKHQSKETFTFIPKNVGIKIEDFSISYLPPFSGIKNEEEEYANQETLWSYIYQGLPGNVIRNILIRLFKNNPEHWRNFTKTINNLFNIEILDIESHGKIFVEYQINAHQLKNGSKKTLEINTLGSGTLQCILLSAFLYWNKSNVILLDEPDSHEHSFLQREIYTWIKKISQEMGIQVIISTHSEVFVNEADIDNIISFFNPKYPKKVFSSSSKIISALKYVSQNEALLISEKKFLLITEDYTDIDILKELAQVLDISIDWKNIFIKKGGQSDKKKIFDIINHFQEVEKNFNAFWIRDGDCNETQNLPPQLEIQKLSMLEIENYIFTKNIILRFLGKNYKNKIDSFFQLHKDLKTDFSQQTGSKSFTDLFTFISGENNKKFPKKNNFYKIASVMNPEEIPDEIKDILLKIKSFSE